MKIEITIKQRAEDNEVNVLVIQDKGTACEEKIARKLRQRIHLALSENLTKEGFIARTSDPEMLKNWNDKL